MKGILFTDLDGTLLKSDGTFCPKDIEILEKLGKMGIVRVLATGRSLFSFQRSVKVKLPLDYMIFSTGAGICTYPEMDENIIRRKNLSSSDLFEILENLEEMGLNQMVHREIPNNHMFLYKENGEVSDFNKRLRYYGKYSRELKNGNLPKKSAQVLSIVNEDPGDRIVNEVRRRLPGFTVIKTTSPFDHKSVWIEVFHRDVSKSSGARWLTEKLGGTRDNTFAIGNDYNDLDLLKWAGKSAVVDNAPFDLKEIFYSVTSHNNSGVSEAVKLWLDNEL